MKVEYVDHMGSDLSIVNAARVSFDKTSEWDWIDDEVGGYPVLKAADEKLIQYLAKHDHWTPFAHTSITLRMKAPVPIRTQCFKHKQGLVENEESRRYISSTPELYIPEYFRCKPEGSAKQGSAGIHPHSDGAKQAYVALCSDAIALYESFIEGGICPEQARFVLPQGVQVNWIWTGNLYAFANFYLKRTDAHAQQEVQQLAAMVSQVVAPLFPVSWKALTQQ
uniref:Putative thymidylate synthase n=1 Tax=viral metagenome TaxID=1070528 RepID=A0A6H2A0R9_9ZZZZ